VSSEVLGVTIYSHRDLEPLRRGFHAADNPRRPRVLDGKTPIKSWRNASRPDANSSIPKRTAEQAPTISAKHALLSKLPRRSHNQTLLVIGVLFTGVITCWFALAFFSPAATPNGHA
jgi:hypothetical protein